MLCWVPATLAQTELCLQTEVVNVTVGSVCLAGESSEGGSVEKACWRIGLKVAWDIHTPGLMLPLESGDCYYMRGTKSFKKKITHAHVNTQLTHSQGNTVLPPRVTLKDEPLLWPCFFFSFNVSCTLSHMTHADRMHFTFALMRYSLRLSWRNGAEMCVRTCVGVRGVTWPEHRALRFHEIVCIREVRKTKCYFFEVLWPSAGYVSMERTDS